jgi:hypothetical protein
MLDRDYKRLAIQMAITLPDDKESARRVCEHLLGLVDNWLYEDKQNYFLEASNSLDSVNNVAKLSGKAEPSPL